MERQRLIEVGVNSICDGCDMESYEGYPSENNKCYAKRWIDEQPTVDAVEVVRCEDCMYGKVSDMKGCVWCTCYEIHKSLNGFCDYGERKDGDSDGRQT